MNRAAIAILAVVCGMGAVDAQTATETKSFQTLLRVAIDPSSNWSFADRVRFVAALRDYCSEVLSSLPTNTPREADWLEAEMKAATGDRLRRLASSAEYSRKRLGELFGECAERVDVLAKAQATGNRKAESLTFASLAATFNSDKEFEIYARRSGFDGNSHGFDWISSIRFRMLVSVLRAGEEAP